MGTNLKTMSVAVPGRHAAGKAGVPERCVALGAMAAAAGFAVALAMAGCDTPRNVATMIATLDPVAAAPIATAVDGNGNPGAGGGGRSARPAGNAM
jgi:hypothetical protein